MKVSLNWLTDYVDIGVSAGELADRLTTIGLCCEEIIETDTDIVFDLEVTSNRGDCLGHLGVAREISVLLGQEFRPPQIGEIPQSGRAEDLTAVEVLDPDLCPRYTARVLRGVTVQPSPRWMVERLEAVGLRGINNVVDVTNYILMEYGQPLHSFDYDKLGEHRIVVRRAKNGEMLVSIDETKCELDDSMLIIADASKPVAIAGVMGGLDTEVDEHTTNVLIEAAQFDPLCIRRCSRRLALMSESNYRFERGVDPVAVDEASLRACDLILQFGGGELAEGVVDVWARPHEPMHVSMRPARCNALLGVEVAPERQAEILSGLGLAAKLDGDTIVCTIPSHRADLTREVDLIEEVARLHGFDNIPIGSAVSHPVEREGAVQQARRRLGELMAAAGYDESLTFTFIDDTEAALFGLAEPVCVDASNRRTNNALRQTIWPSLLRACKANQDVGNGEVSLWEMASVFPPGGEGHLPAEHTEIAIVTTRDIADLRGAVEAVVTRMAPKGALTFEPAGAAGLAEGAAAEIRLDGEALGALGRIAAKAQDYYSLERPIAAARIRFEPLIAHASEVRTYQPLAKFPAVRRDLSLIVDEATTWRDLANVMEAIEQPMREGIEYVTTYRGKPIPAGRKSVTVTLVYRSSEGTLRREQVDEQERALLTTLREKLGAELRT